MILSRLAPTPSGYLHAGNAFNFLLTQKIVKEESGSLRLRIDDLDAPRRKPEYIHDIFDSLQWLGIECHEGARNADEHLQVFSQQLRRDRYQEVIDQLLKHKLVYACNCSRREIAQQHATGLYPGHCRHKGLPLDHPDTALRMHVPQGTIISFEDERIGKVNVTLGDAVADFIIRRRDGIPAYHIASLADDVDQQVNLIVRGEDLLNCTAAQLYLSQLAGMGDFSKLRFYHHPLVLDQEGNKLSKSAGSSSLKTWREEGRSREELVRMLSEIVPGESF